jgi:hypothetical protein
MSTLRKQRHIRQNKKQITHKKNQLSANLKSCKKNEQQSIFPQVNCSSPD